MCHDHLFLCRQLLVQCDVQRADVRGHSVPQCVWPWTIIHVQWWRGLVVFDSAKPRQHDGSGHVINRFGSLFFCSRFFVFHFYTRSIMSCNGRISRTMCFASFHRLILFYVHSQTLHGILRIITFLSNLVLWIGVLITLTCHTHLMHHRMRPFQSPARIPVRHFPSPHPRSSS